MSKGRMGCLAALGMGLFALAYCGGAKPADQEENARLWDSTMPDVQADDILKAFAANEIAAGQDYDRPIQITGMVKRITSTMNGGALQVGSFGGTTLTVALDEWQLRDARDLSVNAPVRIQCDKIVSVLTVIGPQNCILAPIEIRPTL
jgi:hypothetical protein